MNSRWHSFQLTLAVLFSTAGVTLASGVSGTFIQLNRAVASNSVEVWRADLQRMKALGIETLIVQWTAEEPVLYFQSDTLPFDEQYPAIDALFEAIAGSGMSLYLGLQNEPTYWTQIKGRDRVVRDFFLQRVARNERLQKALIERFGGRPEWVGYYIPDEVDDLSWRHPDKRGFMKDYLTLMTRRLKANDPARAVSVSAFFRGRTAPDIFARDLFDLTASGNPCVDVVLVQDGVGCGDPPEGYLRLYLQTLRRQWKPEGPKLWGVVEAFAQTSSGAEPFAAVPGPPARVCRQLDAVQESFDRSILFTFNEYVHPDRGAAAAALYKTLADRAAAGSVAPSP